jgi:hypothetical protein
MIMTVVPLLALSMVMTSSRDETEILRIATTAVPSQDVVHQQDVGAAVTVGLGARTQSITGECGRPTTPHSSHHPVGKPLVGYLGGTPRGCPAGAAARCSDVANNSVPQVSSSAECHWARAAA